MKERYKSKGDINNQIQRIYKNHGEHRLYNTALYIAIRYNDNMSNTKENCYCWENYLRAFNDDNARQEWLSLMKTTKYPKSVYAQIKKNN